MAQNTPSEDSAMPLLDIRGPTDFARAFRVPRETVDKLELYADLLKQWQKAVNLVSPATLDHIWQRHFADSAQLVGLAPEAKSWVDLGSGGGFPGLVIAIMLTNHQNHVVHLIESNSRKCAFLSEVARQTGVQAVIHEGRVENIALGGRVGRADIVTSRALAPLNLLLGLASGFLAENTRGLFLKGRDAQQEIDEALMHRKFDYRCQPSCTSGESHIVEITRLIS